VIAVPEFDKQKVVGDRMMRKPGDITAMRSAT